MQDKGKGSSIIFSVLMIIFCAILVGSLFRLVFGGSLFTLSSFLDYISKAPTLEFRYIQLWHIGGNWGLLEVLRNFFNGFGSIFSFLIWLGDCLNNCILYIIYFIKFLIIA